MPMPSVILSTVHTSNIIPRVVFGIVASLILGIPAIALTITIIVFLWLICIKFKRTSVSMETNPAYEVSFLESTTTPNPRLVNLQDMDASHEYDIVTPRNAAYISVLERGDGARDDNIITETNEAYIRNSATSGGEDARDTIITEPNEAYIIKSRSSSGVGASDAIITERNEAYINNSVAGSGDGERDTCAIIMQTNEAYIRKLETLLLVVMVQVILLLLKAYSVTSHRDNTELLATFVGTA